MQQHVDCLLIGHNQVLFDEYESAVRRMGVDSGAYRDFAINTIQARGRHWNPASIFNELCIQNADGPVEPIRGVEVFSAAIAYLGTFLHKHGFTFDYVNSFQDEKELLAAKLTTQRIRAVAVITTLYVTAQPIDEIIAFVRSHNEEALILVGGPFVTTAVRNLTPEQMQYVTQSVGADVYVNSSQGEETLVRILRALRQGDALTTVPNVYYRNGKEYGSTGTETEQNPIETNMVDWSLFDPSSTGKFINVRTAISCPFTCSFCGFPEHAGKYQFASVPRVEQELDAIRKYQPGVRSVTFTDDTFNVPPNRFKDLLRMMIRNDYPFRWNSFYRCQFADEETVDLMRRAKCEAVFLGLESASPQVLKNMNKAATVEQYRHGIELLRKYGIVTFANFVVGFPGETEETVAETIDFINDVGIDFFRAQMFFCEHITPIWRQRDQFGLTGASFDWKHDTMDSDQAADMVDRIVLSVTNPTRLPQYYFDYDNIIQLTHKGLGIEAITRFLRRYDDAVKEKLRDRSIVETREESLDRILSALSSSEPLAAAPAARMSPTAGSASFRMH